MFAGPATEWVGRAVLTVLLAYSCATDLRTRRIPNRLVVTILALGVAFQLATHPVRGAIASLAGGLAVGLLIWMPFWLLRMIGAGDVKLFAAAAAWLGAKLALEAALVASVAGAVLSLGWLLWARGVRETAVSLSAVYVTRTAPAPTGEGAHRTRGLPYAIALAAGVLSVLWVPSLVL